MRVAGADNRRRRGLPPLPSFNTSGGGRLITKDTLTELRNRGEHACPRPRSARVECTQRADVPCGRRVWQRSASYRPTHRSSILLKVSALTYAARWLAQTLAAWRR